MFRSRLLVYAVIYSFFLATLGYGEVRKVTKEDLELGDPSSTITSPSGHVGHYISNQIGSPPMVDVRDHGADNTGVADSTSAINAAIAAAGRTPVFIPIGNYKTTTPIVLKNGTRLIGAGRSSSDTTGGGSRIVHSSATLDNVFTVGEPDSGGMYTFDIEVANIGVIGNSNTDAIFNLHKVGNSHFHDMTLFGGKYAIWIDFGMNNTYERIATMLQSEAGAVIGTSEPTTTQTFRKMYMSRSKIGIDIQKWSTTTHITDSAFELFTTTGINVYLQTHYTSVAMDKIHAEQLSNGFLRIGVDGSSTGGEPIVRLTDSVIQSGESPRAGNCITIGAIETLYLSGNLFQDWDNVVKETATATIPKWAEILVDGNDGFVANNRFFSATFPVQNVFGINRGESRSRSNTIGVLGTTMHVLRWNATSNVTDNSTVTHGLGEVPVVVLCTPSVRTESCQITALDNTTFTVGLTKNDGSAGTSQTLYWMAVQ